jgi:hypothetical protein
MKISGASPSSHLDSHVGSDVGSDVGSHVGSGHGLESSPISTSVKPSRRSSCPDTLGRGDTGSDIQVEPDEMDVLSDGNGEAVSLPGDVNERASDSQAAGSRLSAKRSAYQLGFTVPGGRERRPSRNSGVVAPTKKPPYVNKAPQLAPQKKASEASLLKRGLTTLGEATMSRRASGANDPENITIVNLVDHHGKKWSEVADILNGARIAKGLQPSFTANGVHNRYNRNAPLLSAAEGREFIPVCERNSKIPKSATSSSWTPELDKTLVETVKAVEAEKWPRVAQLFNEITGMHLSAEAVAYRNSLI